MFLSIDFLGQLKESGKFVDDSLGMTSVSPLSRISTLTINCILLAI